MYREYIKYKSKYCRIRPYRDERGREWERKREKKCSWKYKIFWQSAYWTSANVVFHFRIRARVYTLVQECYPIYGESNRSVRNMFIWKWKKKKWKKYLSNSTNNEKEAADVIRRVYFWWSEANTEYFLKPSFCFGEYGRKKKCCSYFFIFISATDCRTNAYIGGLHARKGGRRLDL